MADVVPLRPAISVPELTTDRHRLTVKGVLPAQWLERMEYRRILREELLPQPDSVLADVGLTRSQVRQEAQKPFWVA
ncbi:MAG: hypothetical protein AAFR79_16320 [Pseudomonadota bacterium]